MAIFSRIDQLIGSTPLLRLARLKDVLGLRAEIYAKLEYLNPMGSVKDRTAKSMIEGAIKSGRLKKGGMIIEPTSGNTGISLSALGARFGYQVVIVMPDNFSLERRYLIEAFGAKLVLTDGRCGMHGAIERANELALKYENAVVLSQFSNFDNPKAHEQTGAEIFADLGEAVDVFVAGVGTGGTLTGVSRFLKSKLPRLQTVAVEPKQSAVLSGGKRGAHDLQGIGAGFVPQTLDVKQMDEIVCVSEDEAIFAQKTLAKTEGVLCGSSSGAAIFAAIAVAKRDENVGKNVVVILPDNKFSLTKKEYI